MVTPQRLDALKLWLHQNGGYFNPETRLEHNDHDGVHCRAATDLDPYSRICTVPHALALSSLNALVDDVFPVFKQRGLAVEAIGYFYLMYQYAHRETSFWKPYLETLPGPEHEHRTPFWFDQEDLAWLEDTDVLHTLKARKEVHKIQYVAGINMLQQAKVDIEPYTWDLYRWSITMYTSRSFSSRALHSVDTKYWAAYKSTPDGRRQTVLLDMSRTSAEELDFPVLFPVMDIPNHAHDARVDWAFDPGHFSLSIRNGIKTGAEVFNNYGPKSNDELLLGYGFCLEDNPHDKVLLTLKPPPEGLQTDLRRVQPGYFDERQDGQDGEWSSEKATFGLQQPVHDPDRPEAVFDRLPEPLLELMIYMLRHERGLSFFFIERPLFYLTAPNSSGRQYLPHITRMIVTSLLPKLAKLQASTPQTPPANMKQQQAKIYRDGQMRILEYVTGELRMYLRSLLTLTPSANASGPMLVTIQGLLSILGSATEAGPKHAADFLNGLAVSAGTSDLEQMCEAGWEDDACVLLLCFIFSTCGISDHEYPEYLWRPDVDVDYENDHFEEDELEQAKSSMELVRAAAQVCPDSFWTDKRWSERFIAGVGGRILKHESFTMMVPTSNEGGDARLVVYIHPS